MTVHKTFKVETVKEPEWSSRIVFQSVDDFKYKEEFYRELNKQVPT